MQSGRNLAREFRATVGNQQLEKTMTTTITTRCILCNETNCTRLDLNDCETISCSSCEESFSVADLEEHIGELRKMALVCKAARAALEAE